jgi:acyl transferase domain-containing protein
MYLCFSKTPALSVSGTIKPFDEKNDGTLIGQGIGMVALKRLADAERDGDQVYAVIKGMGSSSDGRFKSIYAPRVEGQVDAMHRAYAAAGLSPESVRLLECHGTGTPIGDMVEVEALKQVFGAYGLPNQSVAIGTVKSQIGHTKCAAGAAGIIKAVLALHHRVLPPTINVTTPNRQMALADSPFYPNTQARPWITDPNSPVRRAGVSSFGFGGTNFHCVLEETPERLRAAATGWRRFAVYGWHAPSIEQLLTDMDSSPTRLADADAMPEDCHRVLIVAGRDDDIATQRRAARRYLEGDEADGLPVGVFVGKPGASTGLVAAMFAGQGSQYTDMGARTAVAFPAVLSAYEAMSAERGTAEERDSLGRRVFPSSAFDPAEISAQQARLRATEYAQPAIGALSQGQYEVLRSFGFAPHGAIGHSFGELTALWAAASLSDEAFRSLACRRGSAIAEAIADGDTGAMAAVAAGPDVVRDLVAERSDLSLCNFNGPEQVVVGGPTDAVSAFLELCSAEKIGARMLAVAAAFHTPLMAGAVEAFAGALESNMLKEPAFRVYANTIGARYGADEDANKTILSRQIVEPVHFADRVNEMYDDGFRVFVEFGPKSVLATMAAGCLQDRPDVTVLSVDHGQHTDGEFELLCAAARLVALGVPLTGLNSNVASRQAPAERSPATIQLNGAEYVPPRRRKAYEDALDHGYRIEREATTVEKAHNGIAQPEHLMRSGDSVAHQGDVESIDAPAAAASGAGIWQIAEQHLVMHRAYLSNQLSVADRLSDLLASEAHTGVRPEVISAIDAVARQSVAISDGHVHASDVLRSFAELESGAPPAVRPQHRLDHVRIAPYEPLSAVPNGTAPGEHNGHNRNGHETLAATPIAAPATAALVADVVPVTSEIPTDPDVIGEMLIEVIADKTGYPPDMLELGMHMEADLGIDSIKRVEILSSVQEKYPDVTAPEPERLFALETLNDVVDFIAEIGSAAAAPAKEAVGGPKAEGGSELVRREVQSVPLPASDHLDNAYGELPVVVIAGTDTPLAQSLAERLAEIGWTVHRATPQSDAQLLVWVMNDTTDVRGAEDDLVAANVFASQALPALAETAAGCHRVGFIVVTRCDGQLGMGAPERAGAVSAGVSGLVKTVGMEYPKVFSRLIDVAPNLPSAYAAALIERELADPDHALSEVGWSDRGRNTLRAGAARPADTGIPRGESFTSEDVIVFTGGGRGVVAECAVAVAATTAAQLLLVGRTALRDEPAWAVGVPDADLRHAYAAGTVDDDDKPSLREIDQTVRDILAQREVRATLKRISAQGNSVEYVSADVCDADALRSALSESADRITAIVHGAGTLMDKRLPDKTESSIRAVLGPKLRGFDNLLAAVDCDRLRSVVLFASVAGFYGNAGQSDYAMANEALAKLGVWLSHQHRDVAVGVVAWWPWEGGMVRPELANLFRERGIEMIDLDRGARICAVQLASSPGGPVVELVGAPEPPMVRRATNTVGEGITVRRDLAAVYTHPVLADHAIAGHIVMPAAFALGGMINTVSAVAGFEPRVWRDFSVLKGIVLDGSEPAELSYCINERDGEIAVLSRDPSGRPRYRLSVSDDTKLRPQPARRTLPERTNGVPVTSYHDGTMFHGPSLQGMQQILVDSEDQLIIECCVNEPPTGYPEYTTDFFDPVIADVALQVLGVWVRHHLGISCLPAAVARVDGYRRPDFGAPFIVIAENFRQPAPSIVVADIVVCDATGEVCCVVDSFRVIGNAALNEVFAAGADYVLDDAIAPALGTRTGKA